MGPGLENSVSRINYSVQPLPVLEAARKRACRSYIVAHCAFPDQLALERFTTSQPDSRRFSGVLQNKTSLNMELIPEQTPLAGVS